MSVGRPPTAAGAPEPSQGRGPTGTPQPWLVRADDSPQQPWKNGGGTMRELLVWPPGEHWHARVGVAEIAADGPFSDFPGIERWFLVLEGAGVELTVRGASGAAAHRITRIDPPLQFDGGAPTTWRLLDGPAQALNLMLRGARGGIETVCDAEPWAPPRDAGTACGVFSAVAGHCNGIALPSHALLWFDAAPPQLTFVAAERPAGAVGWWFTATPLEAAP